MLRYISTGVRRFGDQPLVPHRRTLWEFYAVTNGRIAPWLDLHKIERLCANTLWIFQPTCMHGWRGERGRPARIVVFHFDEVPAVLVELTAQRGWASVPLVGTEAQLLQHQAKEILPYHCRAEPALEFYAQRTLMELTVRFLKRVPESPEPSRLWDPQTKVRAAENWYRAHLSELPTLKRLACETAMSEGHLRRLFRLVHHCGPKSVMTRIQMQKSVELLSGSDLKLEAVAEEAGFASLSAFCNAFKRCYGITPTTYRHRVYRPEIR